MKNKVGLVSVRNFNYGSILQAFAFQKVLFSKGVDNEIIYYEKKNSIRQVLRIFNYPLLKAKCKTILKKVYCKFNKEVNIILSKRDEKFAEFVSNNLVFSERLVGRRELIRGAKQYSAFILGSDQVWNPMNLGSDFYTLTFVPDKVLKVTYASSFGVSMLPTYQTDKTKEYLSRIEDISVRETSGATIVKDLINREVPVVVDPTMLFDFRGWNELIPSENIVNEPYIFAYFVGASPEHRDAVLELSAKTGYKVVGIPFVDEIVECDKCMMDINYAEIGPVEFVNLIRHAQYICTDSFHATIFSVQYHKNFFVFDRYKVGDKASMNSRLSSVLKRLGLEERCVSKKGNILQWYTDEINYSMVDERLMLFRRESEEYLDKIVDKVKNV